MLVTTYSLRTKWIPWKNVQLPTLMVSIAAKELGGPTAYASIWDHGKEQMVRTAREVLSAADIVVTWNGNSFDLPTVNREILSVGLPEPAPFQKFDLMRKVKEKFRFDSNSLGYVSQQLGVGSKIDIGSVPDLLVPAIEGDEEARKLFRQYNVNDVVLTEGVFLKLRKLGWLHTLQHYAMDGTPRCPQCGYGELEACDKEYKTRVRAYTLYQCPRCFGYARGNEVVGRSVVHGVASHV